MAHYWRELKEFFLIFLLELKIEDLFVLAFHGRAQFSNFGLEPAKNILEIANGDELLGIDRVLVFG